MATAWNGAGIAHQRREELRRQRPIARRAYVKAVDLVVDRLGVSRRAVEARRGRNWKKPPPDVALARRAALYLTLVPGDFSLGAVSAAASMTREGVRRALAAVEDLRDDPYLDELMSELEEAFAC